MQKYFFYFALVSSLLIVGQDALAIVPTVTPAITSVAGLVRVIERVADIMFTILMVVAVICVILAGFYYVTGQAEPAKIQKAHQMLIWAAVGIAVGLIAQGAAMLVSDVLSSGGGGGGTCNTGNCYNDCLCRGNTPTECRALCG